MVLSYLVSTAAHAQEQNEANPHDIRSILQLIKEGSNEFGDEKVVGFTGLQESGEWKCDRYSYNELISLSDGRARSLTESGVDIVEKGIVSLLCPTGLEFLISWITLMRMGYGVVLVAPQCSPSAIGHLVKSTDSLRLIYHPKYAELAKQASLQGIDVPLTEIPVHNTSQKSLNSDNLPLSVSDVESASHIFHTSGTSGTPKPIPHTHYHSTSVLSRRSLPIYLDSDSQVQGSGPPESAAFTTTPLFHGGVSDLLRAWMARSMIYFYPTSDVPITSSHLSHAVKACNVDPPAWPVELTMEQQDERKKRYKVTAFLSVPYILSVLAEDENGPGMELLKSMDLVSTGGAPLDTKTGDEMVEKGVRLVSRLGSSECGFLLSSYRDFETENDWEWLRNDSSHGDLLKFEQTIEEGKFEMVVSKDWSSKTKTNRDDGSYATGDLYSPHPTKRSVWKYVGRGDDVIVMSNGEKASPGSIETILRRSPLLLDALVVGADKDQLGLLLFSKQTDISQTELVDQLSPLLEEANAASPSFAQISREMCINLNVNRQSRALPKSSKGTIQRGVAYTEFAKDIEALYFSTDGAETKVKRSQEEIRSLVREIIQDVARSKCQVEKLEDDTDLFGWGVDSLMATRIRARMKKTLNTGGKDLANNVVFEHPTIIKLSDYIYALQEGAIDGATSNPHDLMRRMVEKYASSTPDVSTSATDGNGRTGTQGKTVLLTGATGSLGSFILARLASLPVETISQIICLVRAENDETALERVAGSLKQRGLQVDKSRYDVYTSDMVHPSLGLKDEIFQEVREEVDLVIHAAWPVHFASSLVSFEDSIKGAVNLMNLIRTSQKPDSKFFFCSSLASVLNTTDEVIYETPTTDPSTSSPIGYSQSKWVMENICLEASRGDLEDRIKVLRIGQLCGDLKTGYWNPKEGWPLLFRTADVAKALPVIDEEPSWLPVDLAANILVDIVLEDGSDRLVYHISHPNVIRWSTILDGLERGGLEFKRIDARLWLEKLEKNLEEDDPSRQMLGMWKTAYGDGAGSKGPLVDTRQASAVSPTMRRIQPVDEESIGKMVNAWREIGFLH